MANVPHTTANHFDILAAGLRSSLYSRYKVFSFFRPVYEIVNDEYYLEFKWYFPGLGPVTEHDNAVNTNKLRTFEDALVVLTLLDLSAKEFDDSGLDEIKECFRGLFYRLTVAGHLKP